jgi:large subunit ribosomal protein L25
MDRLMISAELRDQHGKGPVNRLRAGGQMPGVIYGTGETPVSVTLNSREFRHMFRGTAGEHALVDVTVGDGGKVQTVLIQDVQHHPLSGDAIHVDFLRVRMDVKLRTELPISLTGTAVGVKMEGGLLDQNLRTIEVECLPTDLPDDIQIDVSALNIGDSVHVSDVEAPEGVTILTPSDRVVAHVMAPRVVAEAGEVAGEGEGGPERVGEGEKAKEGGEESS